jgi:hypothetical protein
MAIPAGSATNSTFGERDGLRAEVLDELPDLLIAQRLPKPCISVPCTPSRIDLAI